MTNLDSILKSRDITLSTNVRLVKAMVFPVVIYGCESWTIKKAEHRRTDALELWFWRRLLRVPWTARIIPGQVAMGMEDVFGYHHLEEDSHSGYKLTFYGESKIIPNLLH